MQESHGCKFEESSASWHRHWPYLSRPILPDTVNRRVALQLTKEDYDLPTLTPKILEIGRHVSLGRGFHLIR